MNTNEIDKIYIGSNEVTKLYNGIVLVWEKDAPPVGRVFNVGNGSGNLVVDGGDPTWSPLQDGDKFIIAGGNYSSITFNDFYLDEGTILVTCEEKVNSGGSATAFAIGGSMPTKNVIFDFHNKVSGDEYGLKLETTGRDFLRINSDSNIAETIENLTIRGVHCHIPSGNSNSIRVVSGGGLLNYNNGAGDVTYRNLSIEDFHITSVSSSFTLDNDAPIVIGAIWTSSSDYGYNEYTSVKRVRCDLSYTNFAGLIQIYNCQDALISGCTAHGQGTNSYHSRLFVIRGQGIIENCYAREHSGGLACIFGQSRATGSAGRKLSILRNNIAYRSQRYATCEIQEFPEDMQSGVMYGCLYKVLGNVAWQLNTGDYGASVGCCVEMFALQGSEGDGRMWIGNNLRVQGNGYPEVTGVTHNMSGYPHVSLGNKTQNDNIETLLDTDTWVPLPGGGLIGAGVNDVDMPLDFYGLTRLNPTSFGAVEAQ